VSPLLVIRIGPVWNGQVSNFHCAIKVAVVFGFNVVRDRDNGLTPG